MTRANQKKKENCNKAKLLKAVLWADLKRNQESKWKSGKNWRARNTAIHREDAVINWRDVIP